MISVMEREQLKVLGKAIMSSFVEAELLGLDTVAQYLSLAFDEVVREAVSVRARVAKAEEDQSLVDAGEDVGGS